MKRRLSALRAPRCRTSEPRGPRRAPATLALGALAVLLVCTPRARTATALALWDTATPLTAPGELTNRTGWRPVPSELFRFEKDPAKAASDPGYYGREYAFSGDAVVENARLAVLCSSAKGRLVLFAKDIATPLPPSPSAPLRTVAELAPVAAEGQPTRLRAVNVLRNADDEVALALTFSTPDVGDTSLTVLCDRSGVVELRPGADTSTLRAWAPIAYGIVPGFIGDDLVYGANEYPAAKTLTLPTEGAFVGLLEGGATELVLTWPAPDLPLSLRLSAGTPDEPRIAAVDLPTGGRSLFLAPLAAPGLWHRETLTRAYLETDVASKWQRPFPAKWKTQLVEAGVRTTFAFRDTKGDIWRGVSGAYTYPVWFDGDTALFHLGKKVPPKGDAIVYCLEPRGTPDFVDTPADLLKATLGRPASAPILDPLGRKLRTHHRRGGDGVHRACTCGCTEAIQAVFEAGEEVARKAEIREALDDMVFFVQRHLERIQEYRRFAEDTLSYLRTPAAESPALQPYLDGLAATARRIPEECEVQRENMKSMDHAAELARRTLALTAARSPDNLKQYMALLDAWRAMGGAQDYVVAQCHALTRKLAQEAGYGCVEHPPAIALARELRARCQRVLRNPDGYEVWADY